MAKTFAALDTTFFSSASHRITVDVRVNQPIERVFTAVAEHPEQWYRWFPGFGRDSQYTSPQPHGVGSTRRVEVGRRPMEEVVIAWQAPTRWAFAITRASMPGITALAEDYRLDAVDDRITVVSWTFAAELAPRLRPVGPLLLRGARPLVTRAFHKLDRVLSADAS
jgi:carbon monoxide dehydrogenase subunit G